MEHLFGGLLHTALWAFFIILVLAAIGVIAIISWIVNAFRKTERAVESGVENIEAYLHR